jgi:type I restriction enzyme S subunit
MKQEIKERVEKIRNGEVPEGYRKTKVGIIPEDWTLDNLKIHVSSFMVPMRDKPKVFSGDTPWCRIEDFQGKYLEKSLSNQNVSKETIDEMNLKVYPKGTVLCSCSARLGICTIVKNPLVTNQTFIGLVPKEELDNEFLYYFMGFKSEKLQKLSSGTTISYLSREEFENFPITYTSIKEQKNIISIISTWDKAIEFKEKLITEKKKFQRGLMQNLLTGEMRFPEFTNDWEKVTIGDVFEEVNRINGNKSTDIDILTISAKHGFLSQKDKFNRVIAGSSLKKYTHLFQNEFAYNKGNSKTAPFGCIFKLDTNEGLVPFVYICFRPTQIIDVDFFDFYFKHGLLDRQLKRIITSGARSDGLLNVSKDNFFNIKISLPSIEEQKKIGFVLRLNQNEIDYSIAELNQLKEQKRGLMQLLLTGIVRVEVD